MQKEMQQVMAGDKPSEFKCPICGCRGYNVVYATTPHYVTSSIRMVDYYECKGCSVRFSNWNTFTQANNYKDCWQCGGSGWYWTDIEARYGDEGQECSSCQGLGIQTKEK